MCNDIISYESISINSMNFDLAAEVKIKGSISQENDFIIYGYYKSELFFSSKSQESHFLLDISDVGNIKDILTCKYIGGEDFICSMIADNKVKFIFLKYHINNQPYNSLTKYPLILFMEEVSNVLLYDTSEANIKLICLEDSEYLECGFFYIANYAVSQNYIFKLIGNFYANFDISNDFSENNCQLTEFNSEFLFCCAITDYILCYRIDVTVYNLIRKYQLKMPGHNYHLTIKSNVYFTTLFYMNYKENSANIFEYYIYLPICKNKEYEILNSLNWNKSEDDNERLTNLFKVETNNYYFEIINPPNNYGYFTLNNTKINGKQHIKDNNYILDFFVTNKDIDDIVIYYVNYSIYVGEEGEEAYSKECKINITILPCYHACDTCSEDISASNENQHNCIKCKDNYYPSPINKANCFTIEEKEINWYLNTNNYEFAFCHEKCKSCSGPSESECTTCNSGLYLENGRCKNNCSEGYFPLILNKENYFICYECYENCKTCFKIGDSIDMGCEVCKDDQIKYKNNCYNINNQAQKIFYDPENNNIESSCYQKFSLYIKEDSYECIELPESEEGYYISNTETGILSKCHENCLSCNYGPIYNEQGILESMECSKCNIEKGYYPIEDSNSTCYNNETILEGYYLDKNIETYIWKKCYSKCETCISGGDDINMNCLSCKIFLNMDSILINGNCIYECINNTFITPDGNCVISCLQGTYQFSYNNSCLYSCPQNYEINDNNKCILKSSFEDIAINDFKNVMRNEIISFVNSNSTKVINGTNFKAVVLTSDKMNPEDQLKKGISAIDLGNCTQEIKDHYNISEEENLIILNMETRNDQSQKNESSNNIDTKSSNLNKNTQLEIYDSRGRILDISVCKEDLKVMKYIGDVEELNIESAMSLSEQGIDVFNAADSFFNDICYPYDNPDGQDIILNDRRNDIFQNISFCQDGCTYAGMNYDLMVANCLCNSSFLQENNNTKNEQNKESVNFKSLANSFISNLLSFNIDVLKCYNLALDFKILVRNIGFYCLSSMFALQIIFLFVYFAKKLKSLKQFMLQFKNKSKKSDKNKNNDNDKNKNKCEDILIHKGNKGKGFNENKINKKSKKKDKIKFNPPKTKNIIGNKVKLNKIKTNKEVKLQKGKKIEFKKYELNLSNNSGDKNMSSENNINLVNSLQSVEPSNKLSLKKLSKYKLNSKKNLIISNNNFVPNINIHTPIINIDKNYTGLEKSNNDKNKTKDFKNFSIISNKRNKIKSEINEGNIAKLQQTYYDIQDLDYEKAIIYDKRSYFRMYWEFLVDSQIILGTFCTDNHLDLFIIKLSFFICNFQINFFLNALFYTDEYISDAYHNDGVLDFFSGLPKSIYSFIATLITTNLLRMLSSSKNELVEVIQEKGKYKSYKNIINNKLSKLRKKLIIYFILIYLLGAFFLYYVVVFCAVYRHSQKYWFFGCLESFGMDSLVGLISCIFLALLRFISIKKRIKCFYVFANILSTFL